MGSFAGIGVSSTGTILGSEVTLTDRHRECIACVEVLVVAQDETRMARNTRSERGYSLAQSLSDFVERLYGAAHLLVESVSLRPRLFV